jgi:hypothetical protein
MCSKSDPPPPRNGGIRRVAHDEPVAGNKILPYYSRLTLIHFFSSHKSPEENIFAVSGGKILISVTSVIYQ